MKTVQSITFFLTVLAMSFLILQVNCSELSAHGLHTAEDSLPGEERAYTYANGESTMCAAGKVCNRNVGSKTEEDLSKESKRASIDADLSTCLGGQLCKRFDHGKEGYVTSDKESKRASVDADSNTCFSGPRCKRLVQENKGALTFDKESKRSPIPSNTVKCGHGRLCKRFGGEDEGTLPKMPKEKINDSVISASDCNGESCKKKRGSIIPTPNCKNKACKK
ncbi:uncharacterized protein FA14DRAFT_181873 [Meira miltonrushii]|uniref:Uncharacterized protein n=1 Tax=Meira miltonrushii TaxID=1280837 RepID=A0A316V6X4_9BASI|nr:uncharacterized protein FA14DRAFT_181873 [Meira miltonrushii]PWN31953.1 hypothetical protein FA14DRAFT_181873 [Meira miltonrushii]